MKRKLTENQISHLLGKGYSYTDITLYEQSMMDKVKAGLGAAGKAGLDAASMIPGVGPAIGAAKTIGKGIANNPGIAGAALIPGVGPAIAAGMGANKAAGNPIGRAMGGAAKKGGQFLNRVKDMMPDIDPRLIGTGGTGNIPAATMDRLKSIGSTIGQAATNNPGAAIGGAAGALSPLPGGAAIGAGLGALADKFRGAGGNVGPAPRKMGTMPFGNFQDLVGKKIKSIQGEGYTLDESFAIFEDFANKAFGESFLAENTHKLEKLNLSINELRIIESEWNKYLVENNYAYMGDLTSDEEEEDKEEMDEYGKHHYGKMYAGDVEDDEEDKEEVDEQLMQMAKDGIGAIGNAAKKFAQNNPRTAGALAGGALGGIPGAIAGGMAGGAMGAGQKAAKAGVGAVKKAGLNVASMVPGMGAAGGAAKSAAKALSKNEEMSPRENYNALRDWASGMKESLMQEKDYDGDGKIESGTAEYLGSRDKAIKKAMGKKVDEKMVFYTDDKNRKRRFDDGK